MLVLVSNILKNGHYREFFQLRLEIHQSNLHLLFQNMIYQERPLFVLLYLSAKTVALDYSHYVFCYFYSSGNLWKFFLQFISFICSFIRIGLWLGVKTIWQTFFVTVSAVFFHLYAPANCTKFLIHNWKVYLSLLFFIQISIMYRGIKFQLLSMCLTTVLFVS